jgi:hypothetical protein
MNKFVFVLLTLSSLSFADRMGVVLSKRASVGFAPVEARQSMVCDIYRDHVEIAKYHAMKVPAIQSIPNTLPSDVMELLAKAEQAQLAGEVEKHQGPMDAPSTSYSGFLLNPNDSKRQITLLDGAGYISIGFVTFKNTSVEAQKLVDLIDTLCPTK